MTLLGVYKLDKPKTWMKGGRRERETARERVRRGEGGGEGSKAL